jgi:AcrR family transcriptional regulator
MGNWRLCINNPSRRPTRERSNQDADKPPRRRRILEAAFAAFTKSGYAATSTLEIATRARVSKRALYQLFSSKQEMLVACITERARRLQLPAEVPSARDRDELTRVLTTIEARLLQQTRRSPLQAGSKRAPSHL